MLAITAWTMTTAPQSCGIVHKASAEAAVPLGERTACHGKYHRPFGVVSKCALREKKEEGPRFSGAKGRGFKSRLAYQKGFPALWGRESFLVYAFLDGI